MAKKIVPTNGGRPYDAPRPRPTKDRGGFKVQDVRAKQGDKPRHWTGRPKVRGYGGTHGI